MLYSNKFLSKEARIFLLEVIQNLRTSINQGSGHSCCGAIYSSFHLIAFKLHLHAYLTTLVLISTRAVISSLTLGIDRALRSFCRNYAFDIANI